MEATRSRLLARLLAALAVLLVLAAALYVYHDTKNAFLWVYMPILDRLLPGEIRSEGGSLSLRGRLEAYGLEYRFHRDDLQIEVGLGRGTLDFSPLSWLTNPPFRARDIRIESVEVRITTHATRDPLAPPLPTPPKAPPKAPEIPVLEVPFAVDRMLIESFRVEIRDGDRTRAIVGPGRIELSGLEPGGKVLLELVSEAELAPGDLGHYQGKIQLGLGVNVDEDGEIIEASGGGDVQLLFADRPEQPPLDIELSLDASSPVRGILDSTITLDAAHHGRGIGRVEGSFHFSRPDSDPFFRALLVLAALDSDLLNIPLAFLGNQRIASATLNGAAVVIQPKRAAPVTAEVQLDVAKLRRQHHKKGAAIPAIDVHAALKGEWDPERDHLDLEQIHTRMSREGKDRLLVDLAAPVTLVLPGKDDWEGLRFPGSAKIAVRANEMDLAEVPHVFAIFGQRPLIPIEGGLLSGTVDLHIQEMGKLLESTGTLRVTDARLSRELLKRDIEPLELHVRLDGRLDTFQQLLVRKLELDVMRRGTDLVSLGLEGSWNGAKDTTELDLQLDSSSLTTLLAELDFAPAPSAARLAGGDIAAGLRIRQAGRQADLELTGRGRVTKLELARGGGRPMTLDLELGADAKLVRETGDLQLREVDLTLQPLGEPDPARIRATGVVPTRKNESDAAPALRAELEKLALRPWLALVGAGDPGLGPLPVNGAVVIGFEEETRTVKAAGSPSIRLRPPSAAGGEEEITVTVDGRVDAELGGKALFAAHVSSGDDDLDFDGVLTPGERPHLYLSSKMRRLQLRKYQALAARPPAAQETPSREAAATAKRHGPLLPLDIRFQGEIQSIHYGAIPIQDALIEVEANGGDLDVSLPAATLDGGAVHGSLKRRAEGTGPEHLDIDLHGEKVGMASILAELAPQIAIKHGKLDLSLSGRAETPLGKQRLDTFRGKLDLLLTNGRIISKRFNAALAGDLFTRGIEGLAFDGLDAQLEIADGIAQIEHMQVLGSAARLDIQGRSTLRGEVDARITAEIGPELQGNMRRQNVATDVIRGVGNLLVVPVQITAQGQFPQVRYAARPGLPGQAGQAVGNATQGTVETIGDTLRFGIDILTGMGRNPEPEEARPE